MAKRKKAKAKSESAKEAHRKDNIAYQKRMGTRRGAILLLLERGKTPEEIISIIKIPKKQLENDIRMLKKTSGYKPEKIQRAEGLIKYVKEIIKGTRRSREKPRPAPHSKTPIQDERRVVFFLKKYSDKSFTEIVKLAGVGLAGVTRIKKELIEQGKIPDNRTEVRKKTRRNPRRITTTLSAREIKERLESKEVVKRIKNRANKLYTYNRIAFDQQNTTKEQIAEEIKERLEWKLKTYDPKRMKGEEKTKLARYVNAEVTRLGYDLKRTAWKQYNKIVSIDQERTDHKGGTTTIRKKLKAPENAEMRFQLAEQASERLDLDQVDKAILYGWAISLTNKRIGNILGFDESRISQKRTLLMKRLKSLRERK